MRKSCFKALAAAALSALKAGEFNAVQLTEIVERLRKARIMDYDEEQRLLCRLLCPSVPLGHILILLF